MYCSRCAVIKDRIGPSRAGCVSSQLRTITYITTATARRPNNFRYRRNPNLAVNCETFERKLRTEDPTTSNWVNSTPRYSLQSIRRNFAQRRLT